MPEEPTVSVCIPTYCRPELLRRAIKSVLDNGFDDFEIAISDDNGYKSDDVSNLVKEFADPRIRYFKHEKSNLQDNYSNAIGLARARYVFKLDDDDEIIPGFLQKTVDFLDNHPGCTVVYTGYQIVAPDGSHKERVDCDFFLNREEADGFEYGSAMLLNRKRPNNHKNAGVFRKQVAKDIDYYYKLQDDIWFSIGLASKGNVGYIPDVLFRYINHEITERVTDTVDILSRSIYSVQNLFEMPAIRNDERWLSIEAKAKRRMFFVLPVWKTGRALKKNGFRRGLKYATVVARRHPEVSKNVLFWPTIVLLGLIPKRAYFKLVGFYINHKTPKVIANAMIDVLRSPLSQFKRTRGSPK